MGPTHLKENSSRSVLILNQNTTNNSKKFREYLTTTPSSCPPWKQTSLSVTEQDSLNLMVADLLELQPLPSRVSSNRTPQHTNKTCKKRISGITTNKPVSCRPHNTPTVDSPLSTYVISPLRWQFLIEADRHVLQSIENSLKNPPQPASLLHSADFFSNILLCDFPAEIFLQRPDIVLVSGTRQKFLLFIVQRSRLFKT